MAQTTVFTLGTTPGSSAPLTIPSGTVGNFAVFTDSAAGIPPNEGVVMYLDTPGQDQKLAALDPASPTASVAGPAEVLFKRLGTSSVPLGVVQFS